MVTVPPSHWTTGLNIDNWVIYIMLILYFVLDENKRHNQQKTTKKKQNFFLAHDTIDLAFFENHKKDLAASNVFFYLDSYFNTWNTQKMVPIHCIYKTFELPGGQTQYLCKSSSWLGSAEMLCRLDDNLKHNQQVLTINTLVMFFPRYWPKRLYSILSQSETGHSNHVATLLLFQSKQ